MSVKTYYEERQKYQDALDALRLLESSDEDILEAISVLELLLSEPEPPIEDIISEYAYDKGGPVKEFDISKITNVEIDKPAFAKTWDDAYILSADYEGIPMTEEELEILHTNWKYYDFVQNAIAEKAYRRKDGGPIPRKRFQYNDINERGSELIETIDMPNSKQPLYRYGRTFKDGGMINDRITFTGTSGLDNEYIDSLIADEKEKISIIRKYVDFDEVLGNVDINEGVYLEFYKNQIFILKIYGSWNQQPDVLLVKMVNDDDDKIEFNYHPFGALGGFNSKEFEENFRKAITEIGEYSVLITNEGYVIYSDRINGFENAQNHLQNIKDNTDFYLAKGDVPMGKLVPSEAIKYAKGGGIRGYFKRKKYEVASVLMPQLNEFQKYDKFGKGGRVRFKDKVEAIAKRLEGTKVPKRLQKDYGKVYDRPESKEAGRRIAGSMMKKGY